MYDTMDERLRKTYHQLSAAQKSTRLLHFEENEVQFDKDPINSGTFGSVHFITGFDISEDENDLQAKYAKTYRKRYGHRYPSYGHVLYLQVGTDVRGPTCIFPRRSSGLDLKKDKGECSQDDNDRKEVEVQIVPAVAGRLLRFGGRDLHTVRPKKYHYSICEIYANCNVF